VYVAYYAPLPAQLCQGQTPVYLQWLFEAKKRYGFSVLNYMVTSNHIHFLIRDNGERDVIPRSIQLIAGRTGKGLTGKTGIMPPQ
jgi:REP element-mobilizing transposase RayT